MKLKVFIAFFIFIILPSIVNALVLLLSVYFFPSILDSHEMAILNYLRNNEAVLSNLIRILTFPVPISIGFWYLKPVFKALLFAKTEKNFSEEVFQKILNAGLIIGFIGLAGWLLGISATHIVYYLKGFSISASYRFKDFLTSLIMGGAAFSISFLLIDILNRKFVLPDFFSVSAIRKIQGIRVLSFAERISILFFALLVFPAMIAYSFRILHVTDPVLDILLPAALLGILGSVVGIVYLVIQTYESIGLPEKKAAVRVRGQNYDPALFLNERKEKQKF